MRSNSITQIGFALIALALLLAGCGGGAEPPEVAVSTNELSPTVKSMATAEASAPIEVTLLEKVSETRVSRTVFDYTYRVHVKNLGGDRLAARAELTAAGLGTTILQGSAQFGALAAGATAPSSNLITLRHDRTRPFDMVALRWALSAQVEPISQGVLQLLFGGAPVAKIDAFAELDHTELIRVLSVQVDPSVGLQLRLASGPPGAALTPEGDAWRLHLPAQRTALPASTEGLKRRLSAVPSGVVTTPLVFEVQTGAGAVWSNFTVNLIWHPTQSRIRGVESGNGIRFTVNSGEVFELQPVEGKLSASEVFLHEAREPASMLRSLHFASANAVGIASKGLNWVLPNLSAASLPPPLVGPVLPCPSDAVDEVYGADGLMRGGVWNLYTAHGVGGTSAARTQSLRVNAETTTVPAKPGDIIRTAAFAQLSGVLPPNTEPCTVGDAEVVLFVHGYQMNPSDRLTLSPSIGGGQSTWGTLPELVAQPAAFNGKRLIPFEFRWNTNASFVRTAHDLAHAIQRIQRSVRPRKIHVVAHSFGGLLARTLMSGLSDTQTGQDHQAARDAVHTLVTIGTPHSGISITPTAVVGLPQGATSLLLLACEQLSCFEAGYSAWQGTNSSFTYGAVGSVVKRLDELGFAKSPHLRVHVGIGLRAEGSGLLRKPTGVVFGDDGLITLAGQRVRPTDTLSVPFRSQSSVSTELGYARVSEHILGVAVGRPLPAPADYQILQFDKGQEGGYYHVGALQAIPLIDRELAEPAQNEVGVKCRLAADCLHAGFSLVQRALIQSQLAVFKYTLNDTGLRSDQCIREIAATNFWSPTRGLVPCDSPEAVAFLRQQDGMLGLDVTEPSMQDGSVGFSLTKISAAGAELPAEAADWACVRDNRTGLYWERKLGQTSSSPRGTLTRWRNWGGSGIDDAARSIAAVKSERLCGFADWRLPTATEAFEMADFGRGDIFTSWMSTTYPRLWTSTVAAWDARAAFVLYTGSHMGAVSRDELLAVVAVRGEAIPGPTLEGGRLVVLPSGGEVHDTLTNLVWRRCLLGMTWNGAACAGTPERLAFDQAAARVNGVGGGWRLPNAKELSSLAHRAIAYPALDVLAFPFVSGALVTDGAFSSTPLTANPGWVLSMSFQSGGIGHAPRSSEGAANVLLVRSP